MDPYQQRARSPSAEHMNNLRQSSSQSPQNGFNTQANTLGVDPSLLAQPGTYPNTYNAQPQSSQPQFDNSAYNIAELSQHYSQQTGISNPPFFQTASNQFSPSSQSHVSSPGANNLDRQTSPFGDHANSAFDEQGFLDPALLDNQEFSQEGLDGSQFTNMATIHQTPSDPPHLLQPQHQRSPHTSPGQQQSPLQGSSHHGRNLSLDPSSAAFPQGQHGDQWAGMNFRHQRSPSDQYSDVSSAASPYLQTADSFDVGHTSPMINGQQDQSLLPDALGLNHFSLSDPHMQQQSYTPAHSPHISPNVSPHPGMQTFNSQDSFGMLDSSQFTESQFSNSMSQGYNQGQEEFPQVPGEQFSPPEIQVEFAPPAKQPSFNTNYDDGLHVPDRSGRGRRALSDPHTSNFSSRSQSPVARSRSPSQPLGLYPGGVSARGTRSPSPGAGAIQKSSHRRSSTSAVPPNREALIALADPARSAQFEAQTNQIKRSPSPGAPSPGSDTGAIPIGASTSTNNSRRVQKHPATFQCHLCPKRFTRAYNLRSHLRTHTDERPFVCTVCGKAFARQHDRKRHEGLHSGEKKFVCKGLLNQQAGAAGGTWGCGRRFARADALGRHFRSEAGRACIKPLLDEEARERQAAMMDQQTHEMMAAQQQQHNAAFAAQQQQMGLAGGPVDYSNIPLPAALLQQYPALAGIQWDAPGGSANMQGGDEDDFGSRSSFDASSGGEFNDFDYEEDGGYVSGPGMGSEYPANGSLGVEGFGGGGYLSDDGRGR